MMFSPRLRLALLAFLLLAAGAGCIQRQVPPPQGAPAPSATAPFPVAPVVLAPVSAAVPPPVPQSVIIRGSGRPAAGTPRPVAAPGPGDVSLRFVDVEVVEVVRSVLGDMLRANYALDPRVQGRLTLETNRPIAREALLPTLEAALEQQGIALVAEGGTYRVVPSGEAPRLTAPGGGAGGGYRLRVVPLNYVTVAEMQRLLAPFARDGSVLAADKQRNVAILAGSEAEVTRLLDTVRLFDVDWMAGMSFGLFTPRYATVAALADELQLILAMGDAALGGMVRLVPIERLNTIVAISPQVRYLEQIKAWIERLDRDSATTERRIFVYPVQHGRAADLAAVLARIVSPGRAPPAKTGRSTAQPQVSGDASAGRGQGGGLPAAAPFPAAGTANPFNPADTAITPEPPDVEAAGDGDHPAGVRITADEINNALFVYATPQEYEVIEAALRKTDIPPVQVLIEATITEVTLNDELRYGLQWFFGSPNNRATLSGDKAGGVLSSFPGFSYLYGASDVRVVLNALESITDVRVVSAPQLMVVNNQTATLQVGDQVPVVTQSAVSVLSSGAPVVNSIQLRDTGVILRILPRVNASGSVLLNVAQEVSEVARTTSSSIDSPTIQQRRISSTVAVADGQTVALGGLIRDGRTVGRDGVPLLQDVPVLGELFRNTDTAGRRTELLVLITPRVVRNPAEARLATDELKQRMRTLAPLLPPSR